MAIYNYKCLKCDNVFDIEATLQEKEELGKKFVCSKCGSREIKQNFSPINFIKNIFISNKGNCCGNDNILDADCKTTKSNPDECNDDKKGGCCCR